MANEKDPRAAQEAPQPQDDAPRDGAAAAEASAGEAGGDSPEALAARLDEALGRIEAYKDQALRSQAEAENARRRAVRDVEHAHKFALEKFAADLLPVLDSLEKAVEVASEATEAQPIAEGVELSLKLFLSVLEKYGVERLDPAGEPFDPQVHEAMTMVPSQDVAPNHVLEVMQRGYLLNGRVVRAAKVVVARAPDEA